MFKNKKYILSFVKFQQNNDGDRWEEVRDACLIQILLELKAEYKFEIIFVELNRHPFTCYIKIKCDKNHKDDILAKYCSRLQGKITKVSLKKD